MTVSRGALALVVASLLWGTTGTAASFLPDVVSPLATGAATMTLGGAALFAVSARGAARVLRDRVARGWVALGAVGVFAVNLEKKSLQLQKELKGFLNSKKLLKIKNFQWKD